MSGVKLKQIAHIENGFGSKFGIPRQAGLAESMLSRIVFEPEYSNPDALRGLEGFSHVWLIWEFSESVTEQFQPTVRPPRLGGNARIGVFATRSPFRPNPLGLSCVKLESLEKGAITVSGADLMNGTPIFDIKPYIPYADCHPEAYEGYATKPGKVLDVNFMCDCPEAIRQELTEILELDPRPRYHDDGKVYGFVLGGHEIKFAVNGNRLDVTEIRAEK